MEIYVLVYVFQGIVDSTEAFWNEEEAKEAFEEYTGYNYDAVIEEKEILPEKFEETKIFGKKLPY